MTINRTAFYTAYRGEFGALTQLQVDGLNKILDFLDRDHLPRPWQAYFLATIFHECAKTWRPIEEAGARPYFNKYEPGTKLGTQLGNTRPGDGYLYRGRGYVQLTGRRNYAWASALPLKVDFVATPEAACEPEYAWAILVAGCTVGAFTGRKLGAYVARSNEPGFTTDFINARRVINGLDRAVPIAGYAVKFEAILRSSESDVVKPVEPVKAGTLREELFTVLVEYGRGAGHGTDETFAAVDRVLSLVGRREAAARKEFDDLRAALRAVLDAR